MYISKSVILGFLFVALGLAAGWMLHASANEAASASSPVSTVLQDAPIAFRPTVPTGSDQGTSTSITDARGVGGTLSGDSSTVNTRTHIEQTASGDLVGTSQALTPGPGVPDVPTVPTGPQPSATAAPSAPAAAAAPAYPPPVTGPAIQVGSPTPTPTAGPAAPIVAPQPAPAPSPITVTNDASSRTASGQGLALEIPPFFGEKLFTPLPTTTSRGIAFSEWESYRTDVAGRNILVTTDDSNFFRDRNGKLNGNTGDTDASGLNVTDATDSVIRGTESADHPPYDTATQGVVDIAKAQPHPAPATTTTPVSSHLVPSGDTNTGDPTKPGQVPQTSLTGTTATSGIPERAAVKQAAKAAAAANTPAATPSALTATAAVASAKDTKAPAATTETNASGGSSGNNSGYDFPYVTWAEQFSHGTSSAVHTDEGTTLASGQEAVVIGGDGYDDDDNRATGENIIITRDDDNVVIGGTGDVNAQIGDSEQGAVIMGVTRTFIQGGGAY